MKKVIDISWHKGDVDLQQIKDSGVDAVILKCTDGYFMPVDYEGSVWSGFTDPSFVDNWKDLKDLFPWRGAYHFLRVDDEHAIQVGRPDHIEQIEIFHGEVESEGLEWNDIIIIDVEQTLNQISYLSKSVVAKRVEESIIKAEELFKRKPLIYTGKWWWEQFHQYFTQGFVDKYFFWMSTYWPIDSNNDVKYSGYVYYIKPGRKFPEEWLDNLNDRIGYAGVPVLNNEETIKNVLLWQYSASGRVPGTNNTSIDMNYYIKNTDNEEWNELRGEQPQDEEPPIPPEDPPNEDPSDPPEQPPEEPGNTETPEGILRYIKTVLEFLVALINKILGSNK